MFRLVNKRETILSTLYKDRATFFFNDSEGIRNSITFCMEIPCFESISGCSAIYGYSQYGSCFGGVFTSLSDIFVWSTDHFNKILIFINTL